MKSKTNNNLQNTLSPEKIESSIKSFRRLFLFGGILLLLFSGLHLSELRNNEFSSLALWNVLSNFILGLVFFLFAYLLTKRKIALFYVYGAFILYTIIVSILFGSWFNIIAIVIELAFFTYLYTLKISGVFQK